MVPASTVLFRMVFFFGYYAALAWLNIRWERWGNLVALNGQNELLRMLRNEGLRNVCMGTLAMSIFFWGDKIGAERPGSLFETLGDYEVRMYVRMYPGNQRVKSYKVPAKISKRDGLHIHEAYMPNGGVVAFEEEGSLEIGQRCWMNDTSGREWGIELTTEFAP